MERISVIGAGSWGIALANLLAGNGHDVTVWSIMKDEIEMLDKNHEHLDKLPGVKLIRLSTQPTLRWHVRTRTSLYLQFRRFIPETPHTVWRLT